MHLEFPRKTPSGHTTGKNLKITYFLKSLAIPWSLETKSIIPFESGSTIVNCMFEYKEFNNRKRTAIKCWTTGRLAFFHLLIAYFLAKKNPIDVSMDLVCKSML